MDIVCFGRCTKLIKSNNEHSACYCNFRNPKRSISSKEQKKISRFEKYLNLKYLKVVNSLGSEFSQSNSFKSTQVSAHKQVTPGTMKKVHQAQS